VIDKKTVLVLGAGASNPYGFPTGPSLVDAMCKGLGHAQPIMQALAYAKFDGQTIAEFHGRLCKSSFNSIDRFLFRNTQFLEMGKAAIAAALIPYESVGTLSEINDANRDDRWYEYFFQQIDAQWDRLQPGILAILTYNYDRSFEYFLYRSFRNGHGMSDHECRNALARRNQQRPSSGFSAPRRS